MTESYEYFKGKKPDRIYISRRISSKNKDESISNIRYVSKITDSEEQWEEIKHKESVALRVTPGGRQEILAKVLEKNNGIYVLTIQRWV